MAERARVLAGAVAAYMGLCGAVFAADPKVPPGQDPGGAAVVLIGAGVDYTRDTIAPRLARDGEGELIGWDMIDNDRAPYAPAGPVAEGGAPAAGGGNADDPTVLAELMLGAYSKGRLVPVRVAAGDAQALAKAIAFSSGTPARIVAITLDLDTAPLRMVVRQASERFRDHLFVVQGDIAAAPPANGRPPLPGLLNLANVLVVTALADAEGRSIDQVIAASDIVVQPRGGSMFGGIVGGGPPRNGAEAVALAAAASACQGHGREQALLGSAAKAAVLDAARPLPDARAVRALDPMCWYGGVRF